MDSRFRGNDCRGATPLDLSSSPSLSRRPRLSLVIPVSLSRYPRENGYPSCRMASPLGSGLAPYATRFRPRRARPREGRKRGSRTHTTPPSGGGDLRASLQLIDTHGFPLSRE